jgi:pimeloyl-ACP methyl ester carboxylesterase
LPGTESWGGVTHQPMPKVTVNNVELHYEESGSGPPIVFAHGLLWSGWQYHNQVAALQDRFRCITYDFRGQGQSAVTPAGYDMDTLADDAAGLIEKLGVGPVHFVGLSMGGFVAMRLAARRPELIRSLVLIGTSADPEPAERVRFEKLLTYVARWISLRLVVGKVMKLYFGQQLLADPSKEELRAECKRRICAVRKSGALRAVRGVIDRSPIRDELAQIKTPTLVMVGEHDQLTSHDKSIYLKEHIAGARMVIIQGSGHTCVLEQPEAVNRAMLEFFASLPT